MSGFVLAALSLAVLAALFLGLPLLRRRPDTPTAPITATVAVLAVIAASAIVYSLIGDRAWSRLESTNTGNATIAALARHLESQPQDQSGWLALGGAYGSIGQFDLALRAFERANRLTPSGNAAALAGMGEAILLSGDSARAEQGAEFIEHALQLDGRSPKALFYGGIIAYRQGRLDVARARFSTMLTLSPPENVRAALQKEIDEIDAKQHPTIDVATAIQLHVTLAPALLGKVPANASLFVFVRSPDGGPPLAAKRSEASLPQEVDLSAADSMIAGRAVQPGQKVSVIARVSASGSPLTRSGDLYGQIDYVAGKTGPRALEIDRLSP
jgi:cytochrome c-type biogenesis protein CcmH